MTRMARTPAFVLLFVLVSLPTLLPSFADGQIEGARSYLGFDRNEYPGDENLKVLRQTFSFAGYWLNNPPGETNNTWVGKRETIQSAGFGFLILFNGRLDADLKNVPHATEMGKSDGDAAISTAKREGFSSGTVIFLDQEQGGRMLPEQKAYIYTWVDAINASGFRAGVYCSGIPAKESRHVSVTTAKDIRENAGGRKIIYFVTDDACPPSPGCVFPKSPPRPDQGGISFADLWQFAQSPMRPEFAGACHNYNHDGNCYPPGLDPSSKIHLDIETASSPDPSRGKGQ
jgi:Domain of unknown function (DUF1906)